VPRASVTRALGCWPARIVLISTCCLPSLCGVVWPKSGHPRTRAEWRSDTESPVSPEPPETPAVHTGLSVNGRLADTRCQAHRPRRAWPSARQGSSRRGAGHLLPVARELSNRCSGGHRCGGLQRCERVPTSGRPRPQSSSPPGVRAVGLGPHRNYVGRSGDWPVPPRDLERTDSHVSAGSPRTTTS